MDDALDRRQARRSVNNILAMVDGDLSMVPEDATVLICAGSTSSVTPTSA